MRNRTIEHALNQCRDSFERASCIAIMTAPPLPKMHWYNVTVRSHDGSVAHTEKMHRSSLDSAVSSMRAQMQWRGISYQAIEARPV
jgi:hypothetical protein